VSIADPAQFEKNRTKFQRGRAQREGCFEAREAEDCLLICPRTRRDTGPWLSKIIAVLCVPGAVAFNAMVVLRWGRTSGVECFGFLSEQGCPELSLCALFPAQRCLHVSLLQHWGCTQIRGCGASMNSGRNPLSVCAWGRCS
jgi:hypothetical protein